ncbi:MAG TPA: SUMF1/EgtB/PvdO family nonheme iron enzyme, partial [Candidatus Sulfotelmatobacter sp.]|nr:SUMF1/EgtB/PvdO family nonheme iron enzyme [Candidatus Sulfotelmatobacter sp.]
MTDCKHIPNASLKRCCAPAADRGVSPNVLVVEKVVQSANSARIIRDMVSLSGGTFLMGTDYAEAFTQDGEGPVRPVTLSPFFIDRFPVTNERFLEFTAATAYRTEAEQFGWSFVFWSLIPKKRCREVVEDTVRAAPWWCKVPGATFRTPEGPHSDIHQRGNHPVVHVSWNDANAFC